MKFFDSSRIEKYFHKNDRYNTYVVVLGPVSARHDR